VLPAAAIVLAATRIGLPLAMLGIATVAIVATLGLVIACREAGTLAAARIARVHLSPWIWAIGGFAVFALMGLIPVAGRVAQVLILATGFGSLLLAIWRKAEREKPSAP
jgi:hypothetical protein